MRRSKGYTDKLEKINRDDSGVALNISNFLWQNIGIYYQTKVILCHTKIIIFHRQIHIKLF